MKTRRLRLVSATAGAAAALSAASMAAIFGVVLWRIATNAYGATGDFLSFYAAGYLVRSGHAADLYDPATLEWAQRLLYPGDFDVAIGYPLPVIVAWLFAPFSILPFTVSFFLWMGGMVALLVGCLRLLGSQLRQVPAWPRRVFLVLAGLAMPSVATIVFGQVDLIALVGLTGGYLFLRAKRPALAGLPLCLVLVKPHLLVGVGLFLLVRREWKTLGTLAAVGLPLLVVPALLTAPEALLGNLRLLASYPGSDSALAVNAAMMSNWRGFIVSATNSSDIRLWLPGLAVIALAALAIALPRWRSAATSIEFDRGYGLAVMLPLLISPHLHTQTLVLVLLPAALLLRAYFVEDDAPERQHSAVNWMLFSFCALFLFPFLAIQGLSLTIFLIVAGYLALAFRWPGYGVSSKAADRGSVGSRMARRTVGGARAA